jgi:toxin ParE1/3/4
VSRGTIVRLKAARDVDQIAAYLATEGSDEVGKRFLESVHDTFRLLAANPNLGWRPEVTLARLKGVRSFRVGQFEKVLVFYRQLPKGIEILRVLHGARNIEALFRRRGELE